MFCNECGSRIDDDAAFCPECGHKVESPSPIQATAPLPVTTPTPQQPPKPSKPTSSSKPKMNRKIVIAIAIAAVVAIAGIVVGVVLANQPSTLKVHYEAPTQNTEQAAPVDAEQNETPSVEEEATVPDAEEPAEAQEEPEQTPAEPEPVEETEEAEVWILPESHTRYYTIDELEELSDEELYYARNEIFARLGREFNNEDLQEYFNAQSWYTPEYSPEKFDSDGPALNDYEKSNAESIRGIESKRGSDYLFK